MGNSTGSKNWTVLPKTSGVGIKVDTDAPTWGWRDITADIQVRGPSVYSEPSEYFVDDFSWIIQFPHTHQSGKDLLVCDVFMNLDGVVV